MKHCVRCDREAVGKSPFCGIDCEWEWLMQRPEAAVILLKQVYLQRPEAAVRLLKHVYLQCHYDGRDSYATLDAQLVRHIVDLFEARGGQA